MKRCSVCQQTYSDETSFCLMDGTPLQPVFDQEQSTLVRQKASQPRNSFTGKLPLIGCLALALLVALALGVAFVYFFFIKPMPNPPANQANVSGTPDQSAINKQMANLQQEQSEIDKQKQQLANERQTLDNRKEKPPVNTVVTPQAVDPPTSRITFHRGSVQETIPGTIVKRRTYVLRTLSGQFLSANLSSGGNCAVFSNGSISESYVTNAGDSSLVVVNNCGSPASFRMTVFVR